MLPRVRVVLSLFMLICVMCLLMFIHSISVLPKTDPTDNAIMSTWLTPEQVRLHGDENPTYRYEPSPYYRRTTTYHDLRNDTTQSEIRQRQYSRRGHIQSVCAQNGLGDPAKKLPDINPEDFSRIYVDEKYKILYCEVPKVACTNWKRILLILSGKMNTSDPEKLPAGLVHGTYQDKYLRTLDEYQPKQILNRLTYYYKFMFVREPLERIVSAYLNKFTMKYNERYQLRYGRKIVKKYRKNPTAHALEYGDDVTFPEYVKYLLDSKTKQPFDVHWRPFYQLCHPCLVQYDFVGKYETLDEDVDFVLNELGVKHLLDFPDRPASRGPRTKDKVSTMFANITSEQLYKLWRLFSVDYAMFGYPYPDFSVG